MLRRIRLIAVIPGALITLALLWPFLAFTGLVLDPLFAELTGTAPVNGVTSVTMREERLDGILSGFSFVSALLLASFIGGLLTGGLASSFSGFNGATSAAMIPAGAFARLMIVMIPSIFEPINNPGDVYTRSENLGNMAAMSVAFCVLLPILILAGYLGGGIGDRLLRFSRSRQHAG